MLAAFFLTYFFDIFLFLAPIIADTYIKQKKRFSINL